MIASPAQTPEAKVAYDARWQRVMDCVNLKQPDRLPIGMQPTFWLAKYGNITCRQLMYDYDKTAEIAARAIQEFEPDCHSPMFLATASGRALEALDFKQLQWPGHGVGDNQPFQYLDAEYMKGDEYAEYLEDPTGYYFRRYLPRVAGVFEGFEELPSFSSLYYTRLVLGMRAFARPKVRQALERVMKAAEESERLFNLHVAFEERMAALGYPASYMYSSISPYDYIADYFRGAKQIMTDLFRRKDKLLEMLEKVRVSITRSTIEAVKASGNPFVFIPTHWAPDTFMSDQQFTTYWWPPFRQMLIDLIDAGIIPIPMWESDCTKRLEHIADIPAGKCVYWFERTDMVKAFEVLGDVVALRGNLSPSMMTTGTPAEVDAAVKHLVDNVFNKGGKLILDCAFGIPDETPVENVRAMFDAARRYGG